MGQSSLDSLTSLIMKMFVVLALAAVAAAEPEADPQVVVSGSPLLKHFGYAYKKPVFSYNYPVNTYSYSPYTAFPAVHAIGKREAEAEPEADPALLYHRQPLLQPRYLRCWQPCCQPSHHLQCCCPCHPQDHQLQQPQPLHCRVFRSGRTQVHCQEPWSPACCQE